MNKKELENKITELGNRLDRLILLLKDNKLIQNIDVKHIYEG